MASLKQRITAKGKMTERDVEIVSADNAVESVLLLPTREQDALVRRLDEEQDRLMVLADDLFSKHQTLKKAVEAAKEEKDDD